MNRSSRPGAAPWTVRVAMWSARHQWPVIAAWFVATIGVFAVSLALGGTRAQNAVSTDTRAKYEAAKAYDVFNAGGAKDPAQSLYLVVSSPTSTVDDPAVAAAVGRIVGQLASVKAPVDGQEVPTFDTVADPLKAPPASELVSPDRTTVRIVGRIKGEGATLEAKVKPIPALVDQMRTENPGLEIHTLNNTLANQEISEVINSDLDGSLRLTIPLTFVILLIAFGALVAAAVPLVLAICSLLAAFGLLGIYSQLVTPVSPYASQLIVLIGLAVAVDYSLFMVTRFRSERHRRGYDSHRFYAPSVYLRRIALTAVAAGAIAAAVLTSSPIASIGAVLVVLGLVVWSAWRLMERGGDPGDPGDPGQRRECRSGRDPVPGAWPETGRPAAGSQSGRGQRPVERPDESRHGPPRLLGRAGRRPAPRGRQPIPPPPHRRDRPGFLPGSDRGGEGRQHHA